jgi:hypothetical protein
VSQHTTMSVGIPRDTTTTTLPRVLRFIQKFFHLGTYADVVLACRVQGYQPRFVVNTVLPGLTMGNPLNVEHQGRSSTALIISELFAAQTWRDPGGRLAQGIQPNHYIDVQDVARLHVAALLSKSASGERIFGCTGRFNWNDVLDIWRAAFPWSKFADKLKYVGTGEDESDLEELRGRAEEIMKSVGYEGFEVDLKESVLSAVEGL